VIDRLAQVDSTLGGASSRASLSASWMRATASGSQRVDVYGILYDLELHSNFTYFLDNPGAGDQIRQEDEGRRVLGASLAHIQPAGRHELTLGIQTRADLLDVALRRTARRTVVGTVRADEGTEWGTGAYLELASAWSPRVRSVLGLRGDHYRFDVTSDRAENSGTASDGIVSPKASLMFSPSATSELYLSAGLGFHSNDARGTVQTVDPVSGDAVDPVDPLVRSRGAEVGARISPAGQWRTTASLWAVELESELLFVGDAGTTEPSDGSRRVGLTVTNFVRLRDGVTADLDVSLARARFPDLPAGEDRIPGALERVVAAGVTWEPEEQGLFGSVRFRHFGEYPLLEDNSVRAEPASLFNAQVGWRMGELRIGVSLLNALDADDADIQYFYASRLRGDPADGVEDLHFHPVEPRQLRVTASWGL
jgi:outer membrane receptor protein involved in Fe transport